MTIAKDIKTYFIKETIGYNLVAFLINMPSLGNTNSPTNDELLRRENLTMLTAAPQEINSTGYKRHIVSFEEEDIVYVNGGASITVNASFIPSSGQQFGPFTHIVWCRGANLVGATINNGNNRGNTIGTIYKVEPVMAAPQTISYPTQFNITTTISLTI